jgi:hypothetical protein
MNVVTDEIDEKNTALEMMNVFLEECSAACYDYIEPISKVILELTNFNASDQIRQTAAAALPALLKSAKAAHPENV